MRKKPTQQRSFSQKKEIGLKALQDRAKPEGHYRHPNGSVEGNPVEIVKRSLVALGYNDFVAYQSACKVIKNLEESDIIQINRHSKHPGRSVGESYCFVRDPAPKKLQTDGVLSEQKELKPKPPAPLPTNLDALTPEEIIKHLEDRFRVHGLTVKVVVSAI